MDKMPDATRFFHPVLVARKLKKGPVRLEIAGRRYALWREVYYDARWIPNVAETPLELKGMRLDRFDKPVIRNRKLLQSTYWDVAPEAAIPEQHASETLYPV